jgi:hypothetical protein
MCLGWQGPIGTARPITGIGLNAVATLDGLAGSSSRCNISAEQNVCRWVRLVIGMVVLLDTTRVAALLAAERAAPAQHKVHLPDALRMSYGCPTEHVASAWLAPGRYLAWPWRFPTYALVGSGRVTKSLPGRSAGVLAGLELPKSARFRPSQDLSRRGRQRSADFVTRPAGGMAVYPLTVAAGSYAVVSIPKLAEILMAESEYLAGKVVKWSLPVIPGRPGPEAPMLKRLVLPQGELAQVYDAEDGIRYLAVIETRLGGVRGNHYHKVKEERIYVLQGELLVLVADIQTNARASVPLQTGDLLLIQTGIAHLLQPVLPGKAIEFSTARFNPADSFPFNLG